MRRILFIYLSIIFISSAYADTLCRLKYTLDDGSWLFPEIRSQRYESETFLGCIETGYDLLFRTVQHYTRKLTSISKVDVTFISQEDSGHVVLKRRKDSTQKYSCELALTKDGKVKRIHQNNKHITSCLKEIESDTSYSTFNGSDSFTLLTEGSYKVLD